MKYRKAYVNVMRANAGKGYGDYLAFSKTVYDKKADALHLGKRKSNYIDTVEVYVPDVPIYPFLEE